MNRICLLLSLALSAGCDVPSSYLGDGLPGNRVSYGCSDTDECSSNAPDGLVLRSLSLGAVPYITALGGTQSFSIEFPDGESYDLPVSVEILDSMEVTNISPGQFTIRAITETAPRGVSVAVRDASSGKLLDRFQLDIKPVSDLVLSPFRIAGLFGTGSNAVLVSSNIDFKSTIISPDEVPALLKLGEPVYEVMADESLEFSADPDTSLFTIEQQAWDLGTLQVGNTPGSSALVLYTGAGDSYEFPIAVVDSIESIEFFGPVSDYAVGEEYRFCAIPMHAEEGNVKGVPIVFEATGPVEFFRSDDIYSCVTLTFTGTSSVELTATGLGVSASLVLVPML